MGNLAASRPVIVSGMSDEFWEETQRETESEGCCSFTLNKLQFNQKQHQLQFCHQKPKTSETEEHDSAEFPPAASGSDELIPLRLKHRLQL